MNILIVKPSSFGDIIHTFPAVSLLRQEFPEARLVWLVNRSYAELVRSSALVDDVILFDRRRWARFRHMHEVPAFVKSLRRQRFDISLDFQGLLRSGLVTRLSGAPRRIGFGNAREGAVHCYSERVLLPANLKHAVDKNLFLVQSAFHSSGLPDLPALSISDEDVRTADHLIGGMKARGRPLVAAAPAARWPSKTWPPRFFASVLDLVSERRPDARFWLLGSENEQDVGRKVKALSRYSDPCSLIGETPLPVLAELLRRSACLLTNDSGPMHLSAYVNTPTVALFGPTDPELTGPYGPGHQVLSGTCGHAPCFERECPLKTRKCANGVTEEEAARALLDRLPPAHGSDSTTAAEVEEAR